MQHQILNSTTDQSQQQRRSRPLPWLIILALLIALLSVLCISELALRFVVPFAKLYPSNLLSVGNVGDLYAVWGDVPRIPAPNPEIVDAAEDTTAAPLRPLGTAGVVVIGPGNRITPSPTATSSPTASPTATPSTRPTESPSPTTTPSIRPTDSPSLTPARIIETAPEPDQPVPSATAVPTTNPAQPVDPSPAATATPTATRRPTQTTAPTHTSVPTITPRPSSTSTPQPTSTPRPTNTPTATNTPGPVNVQFAQGAYAVVENSSLKVNVRLSAVANETVSVQYVTSSGTAEEGIDYILGSGTLTFAPGETSQEFEIPIIDDTVDEETETFSIRLLNPINAVLGTTATATVTINDNDNPITVSFEGSSRTVAESAGSTLLVVKLDVVSSSEITVPYTVGGTAEGNGVDHNLNKSGGTIRIPSNTLTTTLRIDLVDDTLVEQNETVVVTLGTPSGARLGSPQSFTVTITDNDNDDEPVVPVVRFIDAAQRVDEGDGTVEVDVELDRTAPAAVQVPYTVSGSAQGGGIDHTLSAGTLTIPSDADLATISFDLTDDDLVEAAETVIITLGTPTGATVGTPASHTVTIEDNDLPEVQLHIESPLFVDETIGSAKVRVVLSSPSPLTTTVDFATDSTADPTFNVATPGDDYSAVTTALTFAPGETLKTVTIPIFDDTLVEGYELIRLRLSNPVNALIAQAEGALWIRPSDGPFTVAMTTLTTTVSETAGQVQLTVRLSSTAPVTVTVDYATVEGTAIAPDDYTATSGTLTFAPGQTSATITVPIIADALDEADSERFVVTLTSPTGALLALPALTTVWINDANDEPVVRFANAGSTVTESAGSVQVDLELDARSAYQVAVPYTVIGTATGGGVDYTLEAGTLLIPPGTNRASLNVSLTDDSLDENDETVQIVLGVPVYARRGTPNSYLLTITDNDASPVVRFTSGSSSVGEGAGSTTVTVELSAASGLPVSVAYTLAGTATGGGVDYTLAGALSFPPGTTTRTLTITPTNDLLSENDETVEIQLTAPVNAAIGTPGNHTLTITDNDPLPTVQFSTPAYTTPELDGNATITVILNTPAGRVVSVNYGTSNGSATQPDDYITTNGTLTFNAGETSKTFLVPIKADRIDEDDETINLTLNTPVNSTLGTPNSATLTITDNDTAGFSFAPAAISTSETAGSTAFFTVTLTSRPTADVTITLSGVDPSEGSLSTTSLTFTDANWDSEQTVTVTGVDDAIADGPITYPITGTAASSDGRYAGQRFTVNATNADDDSPGLVPSLLSLTTNEADGTATFGVRLTSEPTADVTINVTSSDTSEGTFIPYPASLTFTGGTTGNWNNPQTVTITVVDDGIADGDQSYNVNLSVAAGSDPGYLSLTPVTVAVTNIDDDTASLSVDDPTCIEGNSGQSDCTFTVTLSLPSTQNITISYATADDTATATISGAPGDNDYDVAVGSVTIPAGDTSAQVTVQVNGDTVDELDETFFLNITGATGGAVVPSGLRGTATIQDDDDASLGVDDPTCIEGNSGQSDCTFTVTLSLPSTQNIMISYATADGTATEASSGVPGDNDYDAAVGSVTITAGNLTAPVVVKVNGDTVDELDETFFLNITSLDVPVTDPQGMATIQDDDDASLSVDDPTCIEGDLGQSDCTFTVSLSLPSTQNITIDYATADGTATEASSGVPGDNDYDAAIGSVTILAGDTSAPVVVKVNGDTVDELDETFFLNITSLDVPVTDPQGTATIQDDDDASLSVDDPTCIEGNSGQSDCTFTVSLTSPSTQNITINYATADDTATEASSGAPGDNDYDAAVGSVTILAGDTSAPVVVKVNGDTVDELDETFFLNITSLDAPVTDPQGTATIQDDDNTQVSFGPAPSLQNENAGTITLNVQLSTQVDRPVTVNYAANGASVATAGADYNLSGGVVTFNPGVTLQTISVEVLDDRVPEFNGADPDGYEDLTIDLGSVANATLGAPASHTIRIRDNEPRVQFASDIYSVVEPFTNMVMLVVEVELRDIDGNLMSYDQPIDFTFQTSTTGTATAGADYTAIPGTPWSIAAGQPNRLIGLEVLADRLYEPVETVGMELVASSSNVMDGARTSASLAITDDEPRVEFGAANVSRIENSGTATVNVQLAVAYDRDVRVGYRISNGTASAGSDYTTTEAACALPPGVCGTLVISAGALANSFTINIVNDNVPGVPIYEGDETINLTLFNPEVFNPGLGVYEPAQLGAQDTATVTILDDEPRVRFRSAGSFSANEGSGSATIWVELLYAYNQDVTVDYATIAGGTATAGSDYTGVSGSVTIPANTNPPRVSFTVPILEDTLDENDETVLLEITAPGINPAIGDPFSGRPRLIPPTNATLTITDNDLSPTVTVQTVAQSVSEGNSGTTALSVQVNLSAASGRTVTVTYNITGSAAAGSDYSIPASITIPVGATSGVINVTVNGDTTVEPDETIVITLTPSGTAQVGAPATRTHTITIINDD